MPDMARGLGRPTVRGFWSGAPGEGGFDRTSMGYSVFGFREGLANVTRAPDAPEPRFRVLGTPIDFAEATVGLLLLFALAAWLGRGSKGDV